MPYRRTLFSTAAVELLVAMLALMLPTARALGQFNQAYNDGYKPMLGLAGSLKDLIDSDTKRQDFDAVRALGTNYVKYLDATVTGLQAIGSKMKDSDSESWARATRSAPVIAAQKAKAKAEALQAKGDKKGDCKAEALDLMAALAEVSDTFKECWKAHEARRQELMDRYNVAREKWWNATKEDRRPVDEKGQKAASLREASVKAQATAERAQRGYLTAQDECDKARSELYKAEGTRTPDEVKQRYEAWCKAEDMVKRLAAAVTAADKEAAEAAKAHIEAENDFQKAAETYIKEAVEGDELYKIVLGYHAKAYDINQEYKAFSW